MASSCDECSTTMSLKNKVLKCFGRKYLSSSSCHHSKSQTQRLALGSYTIPRVLHHAPFLNTHYRVEDEDVICWMSGNVGVPWDDHLFTPDEAGLWTLSIQLRVGCHVNGIEQAVILGPERCGKTALATAYARKHWDKYGYIMWIDCSTLDTARITFTAHARLAGYPNTLSDDGVRSWREILRRFSRMGKML